MEVHFFFPRKKRVISDWQGETMLLPFCLINSKADSVSKVLTGSPATLFTSQEEKASGVGVGPGNMK